MSASDTKRRRLDAAAAAMEASEPSKFELELQAMAPSSSSPEHQEWSRAPLPSSFDPATTDVHFMQLDAEEATVGSSLVLRFFGITEDGNSVLCDVTGFMHYMYVPAPPGFREDMVPEFTKYLQQGHGLVHLVEVVMKESIWGFNGNVETPFLKVMVDTPKHLGKVRTAFERGEIQFHNMFPSNCMTFDNIQYLLRLMVDRKITGMLWVTLPAGTYTTTPAEAKVLTCQLEVSIHYSKLLSHSPDGDWLKMAPLRVLSFDIECAGRKGIFPEAEHDPVIQIANVVSTTGEKQPFIRNVFTVDTCSPIVGLQIFEHEREQDMLMAWRDFIVKLDPDVIIGYNTANFDLPYLLNRAEHLGLKGFPFFGRLQYVRQEMKDTVFSSKAYGTRENKVVNIDGRMQLDLLQFVQREYKLRLYTLNLVLAHFLNEQKEDVHHGIITDLQNGDAETRRRLAVYCLKDAYLPMRLLEKLMCLINYTEMARVTGVPFSFLLSRGQQIKVISQLFRKCLELGVVIPNLRQEGSDQEYEGATVIEPKRGYYDVPIATLDFASLYPLIMMAHNLCYTTLVTKQTIDRLGLELDKDYVRTPNGDFFVKSSQRQGILPTILQELLAARKQAKGDLKREQDPFKRDVLNGRQLALKISANSVYGFTGATVGKLPCLAILSLVTAFGREMIEKTKQVVMDHYTIKNGYEYDADVIYGDTDSVMVRFGPSDLKECMRLGEEAADMVSGHFIKPIKLEFEKVYFPYLLINKKRYAGLYWTNPDKWDKMDTKGIETVRRDNCRLVQNVITRVLEFILEERNVDGAKEFVKKTISDLLQNKVDLSQLVITKAYTKTDYAAKQAHVELAERMRKRDAGLAPNLGDRVAYVIIKTAGDKNYEKLEDPLYVLQHLLPIDTQYYLGNQLSKPLMRIFEPIMGEKAAQLELLSGAHTRVVRKAAPAKVASGLMRFAKRTETCRLCKLPLGAGDSHPILCHNCIGKAPEYYMEALTEMGALETKFLRLWTECQRCQGLLHQDVLCLNNDCPIFYMRTKAQMDVGNQAKELAKWDDSMW